MYNTGHIQALMQAIEEMKKANAVFKEYCTEHCQICPLKDVCDWDGYIEYNDPRLTEEALDRFVDLHEEITYRQERRDFKTATGIDPAWYDFNEDRSE